MKKIAIFPAMSLFLSTALPAQKVDSTLTVFRKNFPVEKIYIHYDKQNYIAGETIWFKAYFYHRFSPSTLSNNFYLQVSDESGKVIINKKYPVVGATVSGNIDIPDSAMQGNYMIRAFTPIMLSPDAEFIYEKNIYIYGPRINTNHPAAPVSPAVFLDFFPEGGNLIANVNSVIAFKAVNETGQPVEVKGVIKTEDGTMIVPFSSYHDGIGKVQFKAQAGKKYIAVTELNGHQASYPLPSLQENGLQLKVEEGEGEKIFQVSRNAKTKLNFDIYRIVVQMSNTVLYENEFYFGENVAVKGHFLTTGIPSGILQFTVLNEDDIPILERLSFVDNEEYLAEGKLSVIEKGTGVHEKNIIEIEFPDSAQRSCSVTITDSRSEDPDPANNIITSFLLTSDLKGFIYNPAYYFNKNSDSSKKALDNLMLTHGWRRFNWKKLLSNEYPQTRLPDPYLMNITGTVYNEKDNKPVQGGHLDVFLASEDSAIYSYSVPINGSGSFLIDSLTILGRTKIYYTYRDSKEKERAVVVIADKNVLFSGVTVIPVVDSMSTQRDDIAPAAKEALKQRYDLVRTGNPEAKLLENVTVKTKAVRPVDVVNEKYTSELFRTGGKVFIDNINFKPTNGAMNGLDFVKNRVTHVDTQYGHLVNNRNFSIWNIKEPNAGKMPYWEMGLFINEMPADLLQLKLLRADQIAIVKIFEAGFVGSGSEFPGGAIAVYLKTEPDIINEEKKSKYIIYNGYSVTKEFYSPDYSTPGTHNGTDRRTTLFWKPDLYTNENARSVQFIFYNNDISEQFNVVVEGFDSKGKLVHLVKTISR